MSSLTMKPGGEIALPRELRERYGMAPDVPIRIIETRSGILLVPLTGAPMEEDLGTVVNSLAKRPRAAKLGIGFSSLSCFHRR